MKKPLIFGLAIICIGVVVSIIFWDLSLTIKISAGTGLFCLCTAGLFNVSFLGGDKVNIERVLNSREDRNFRGRLTEALLAVGLPNLIFAIILYYATAKS